MELEKNPPKGMSLKDLEGIYYINLDHRMERGAKLKKHLLEYGVLEKNITRIPAILDVENGFIGCAKSHRKALLLAKKNELNKVLILEDDAFFPCDKETIDSHLETFFTAFGKDFDVLFLGGRIDKSKESSHPGIYRVNASCNSHGYIVNSRYYDTLIAHADACIEKLAKRSVDLFNHYYIPHTYDVDWKEYQIKDQWYATWGKGSSKICKQKAGFSDISFKHREERG